MKEPAMTKETIRNIIRQLDAEKYLNAIQALQDEILRIEVESGPADSAPPSARKKIRNITSVIEKISEAAAFGDEWDEGRSAKKTAIDRLHKMIN